MKPFTSIVFLAGVHGVGKGFLGQPAAAAIGAVHYTASQLIRQERGSASWNSEKLTASIEENQAALVSAVNRVRARSHVVVLDGHFVLRDAKGEMSRLPLSVFRKLHLAGVVLLTERSEVIAQRLKQRDGGHVDVAAIEELAAATLEHASRISEELRLPLHTLHSATLDALVNAISQIHRVSPH